MDLMRYGPEGEPHQAHLRGGQGRDRRQIPHRLLVQQELAGRYRGREDGGHRRPQRALSSLLPGPLQVRRGGRPPDGREPVRPALRALLGLLLHRHHAGGAHPGHARPVQPHPGPRPLHHARQPSSSAGPRATTARTATWWTRSCAPSLEEDPDVCYINVADLDNTGHFTGGSWNSGEWDTKGTRRRGGRREHVTAPGCGGTIAWTSAARWTCCSREFIQLLKERGVYDNSIIVVLSDHGMENMKDERNGYEVLDLRQILRAAGASPLRGLLRGRGHGDQLHLVRRPRQARRPSRRSWRDTP